MFFQSTSSYALTSWLFLRALGVIYLIAFLSLGSQVHGLIGSRGILPAGEFLASAKTALQERAYFRFSTLAWFGSSDGALYTLCVAGVVISLFLIFDILAIPALIVLWLLYLSLVTIGQDFLSFQWDILLLESGFLAIFLPFSPTVVVWLFRWLLFRLMFLSGAVKLLSGDVSWRSLTALAFHYETQPIPNPLSWYAHHFPLWLHKFSALIMFIIELAAPFLFFASRIPRLSGAIGVVGFQLLIFATGNYTFFNLQTIALSIFLLDDSLIAAWLPADLVQRITGSFPAAPFVPQLITLAASFLIIIVSGSLVIGVFWRRIPRFTAPLVRALAPFHIGNTYGLFAVMTTERPEIIIEGSRDGVVWKPYEFKYKPGRLSRRPPQVAPHQPRLDWQMWFAALGSPYHNKWIVSFCTRLLENSPPVIRLLAQNPFPDAPPRYIRARLYQYRFTTPKERIASGNWWKREEIGEYLPPMSLEIPFP